jgi:hypothetical protein
MKTGHWKGLTPKPNTYFGFTYKIDELATGRFYIGKRQYWLSNGKVKKQSLRPNRTKGVWNEKHWKVSQWENYRGSSKELLELQNANPDNYTYTMIGQYTCKADLVYAECKAQWIYDVMVAKGADGVRLSYNKQIAAMRFIPPWLKHEEL